MERDLFSPIKAYFEKQGYVCDGEVKDIDLYMEKGDIHVAVELKQTLDFRAVQQAALRQNITDAVYIGIFKPSKMNSHAFRDKEYLLRRLGIGLIVVSKKTKKAEVIDEPVVSELSVFQRANKHKKEALQREFSRRKVKSNTGGVKGAKVITGYREAALTVLDAITELGGCAKASEVAKLTKIEKTRDFLYHDYYGWYKALGKGIYQVTDKGYDALVEFEDVLMELRKNKD